MFWPGPTQPREPALRRLLSLPPKRPVILLGAGASAPAGCPLMRGFIDRARDYREMGYFSDSERTDVDAALNLYQELRRGYSITEEDVENVETLLSIADLSKVLQAPPPPLDQPGLADRLRRFIDAVITKSVNLPTPASPVWYETTIDAPGIYRQLIRALSFHRGAATIITLNYDCIIEYVCHCMGLPFTYNRNLADATEILKLHGSSNWLQCSDPFCTGTATAILSPMEHAPRADECDTGHIRCTKTLCDACGGTLTPIIVPPTWAKHLEDPMLVSAWSRAVDALSQADVFIAVGFSLPISDAHVRQLLHLGFASGNLRQALVVVGNDPESEHRWTRAFRESWRDTRLDVRTSLFDRCLNPAILPILGTPQFHGDLGYVANLLPAPQSREQMAGILDKLHAGMRRHQLENTGIDWAAVARQMRAGTQPVPDSIRIYGEILREEQLHWLPLGPVLPAHGESLGT
jgi:NAD-dependent SIR2 family protein deacetylase